MTHDFRKNIIPESILRNDSKLCKKILLEYNHQKEMAYSWYGPKTSFLITMPSLTKNAFTVKMILRNKKTG